MREIKTQMQTAGGGLLSAGLTFKIEFDSLTGTITKINVPPKYEVLLDRRLTRAMQLPYRLISKTYNNNV